MPMLFLLRLNIGKKPAPAPSRRRVWSPSIGSILITSAPRSASTMPQVGPITMCVNSMTRRPSAAAATAGVRCRLMRSLLLLHRLRKPGAPERAVQGLALQPCATLRAQRQQRVEVLAGLDAHAGQHVGHIFGRDVAAGAGACGQPPMPPQAGIEARDAQLQRRVDVGQAQAARVVEVAAVEPVAGDRAAPPRTARAPCAGSA